MNAWTPWIRENVILTEGTKQCKLVKWSKLGLCLSYNLLLYPLLIQSFILFQCLIHLFVCPALPPDSELLDTRDVFSWFISCHWHAGWENTHSLSPVREEQECAFSSLEEKSLGGTSNVSLSSLSLLSGLLTSLGNVGEKKKNHTCSTRP